MNKVPKYMIIVVKEYVEAENDIGARCEPVNIVVDYQDGLYYEL